MKHLPPILIQILAILKSDKIAHEDQVDRRKALYLTGTGMLILGKRTL